MATKNESNKGDNKGGETLNDLRIELSKEREKNLLLESENKRLKAEQAKQELRDKDLDFFYEDNEKFIIEFRMLREYLISFVQWSNDSQKLLTKKDKETIKRNPELAKAIFERIAQSQEAKTDRERNLTLSESLRKGNELNQIRNLRPHLEKALERLTSFKPKGRKPGDDRPKPKQEAFLMWVTKYGIDPQSTLDSLAHEVDEAYQNGQIEIKIGRDTVRKCLPIIRKKK